MTAFHLHFKRLSGIDFQTLSTCGLLLTASCTEATEPATTVTATVPGAQAQRVEDTCSPDTTPPVVTCDEYGGIIECGGHLNHVTNLELSDNCGINDFVTDYLYPRVGTAYVGAYAVDSSGNRASCTTRYTVVDTHPPDVYPLQGSEVTLHQWQTYVERGAYVYDGCMGWMAYGPYKTTGSVNTALPGDYFVQYSATDEGNNTTTATRTVHVLPSLATVSAEGKSLQAHVRHTTTYIDTDHILVLGGYSRAAEEYNANTKTWTATGLPVAAHRGHTATRLNDGTVLVAGGARSGTSSIEETYNPQTRQWAATGKMSTVRSDHVAVLLANGQVLVAGGGTGDTSGGALASAELYNPSTRTWSPTGSMLTARRGPAITVLQDGQVLVTGGIGTDGTPQSAAELYSPGTGTWTSVGSLSTGRTGHSATRLPSGKVLVAGGQTKNTALGATTEMFDPSTRAWYARRSLGIARREHSATVLLGRVAVIGGYNPQSGILASSEVYDEASDTWTSNTAIAVPRYRHTATLIGFASALLVSGSANQDSTQSELFTLPQYPDNP